MRRAACCPAWLSAAATIRWTCLPQRCKAAIKAGHTLCSPHSLCVQERIRQLHQELFRLAADVHPVSAVLDAVAGGLASKNNRQA